MLRRERFQEIYPFSKNSPPEVVDAFLADGRHCTYQKIADDRGTAREVVSRLLKEYERQGLIVLSRNLIRLTNL